MKRMIGIVVLATLTVGACGGGNDDRPDASPTTESETSVTQADEVSLATARAWPSKWCALEPGTSQSNIRDVMGKPTSSFSDQDQWEAHNFSFTAFYKNDMTSYQLQVGSTDALTDAEKASITCDEARKLPGSDE